MERLPRIKMVEKRDCEKKRLVVDWLERDQRWRIRKGNNLPKVYYKTNI